MENMEQQKRDVVEYCRKLRVSQRPPYRCPNANCLKVYRSICGLQSHLLTVDHTGSSTPVSGRRKVLGSSQLHSPATAQLLDTPAVTSLTYAEAQNTVQFELDGRLTRVNIHDRLELHCIGTQVEPRPGTELQVADLHDNKALFPEPLFRILDSYVLKDAPPMPSSYIRFVECPAEEMDARVEYELDEQDCAWLQLMNELRASKGLPKVREDVLELLMDRLEKECYFQVQRRNKASDADDAPLGDDDAVCCICMVGECHASNAILFCDMCNLAVHQDCYGVPYIPEGQWLCRRCLQSPSRAVSCLLCPNKGGAFKQTDRGCWVHVVCAMWIPEVRFANPVFLEPVDSIELIPAARWKLTCYLCRKRGVGTCIQCHKTNCYVPFHVTCAQHAGLYMRMSKSYTGSTMDPGPVCVQRTVYCGTHSPGVTPAELSQQAARRPASTWLSTSVSIPTIPVDRIQEIASLVDVEKKSQFVLRVIAYWSLKRQLYNGVPLLRRLQVSSSTHTPNTQPAITADGDVLSSLEEGLEAPCCPTEREGEGQREGATSFPGGAEECVGQAAPEVARTLEQRTVEVKPFRQFGKYVATELRRLPMKTAASLQRAIRSCVVRCKLSCLRPDLSARPCSSDVSPSAPSPASSPGSSTKPVTHLHSIQS